MKELIRRFLLKWSCCHDWESYSKIDIYGKDKNIPEAIRQTLICSKCSKIKQISL